MIPDDVQGVKNLLETLRDQVDDLDKRLTAYSRWKNATNERLEELERDNERLQERVGELEAELTPHPEAKEYNELTRDEKVQKLRESLVEKGSARQNGKFSMGYKDVMWLFDGNPSPGHTYDLMELAGVADGFDYQEREDGPNRITVNTGGVNDDSLFHAANKGNEGEVV